MKTPRNSLSSFTRILGHARIHSASHYKAFSFHGVALRVVANTCRHSYTGSHAEVRKHANKRASGALSPKCRPTSRQQLCPFTFVCTLNVLYRKQRGKGRERERERARMKDRESASEETKTDERRGRDGPRDCEKQGDPQRERELERETARKRESL